MNKKTIIIATILSILSFLGILLVYNKLPETIPSHWGVNGEVDAYGPRYITLIIGALPILFVPLFIFVPYWDPKKESYEKHQKAYNIFTLVVIIFLIGLNWLTIGIALGYKLNMVTFILIGTGILFMVMGNYLPQLRQNYSFGIKLPWTFASERTWKLTHRLGGIIFFLMGVVCCFLAFTKPIVAFITLMAMIFLAVIGISIFSYVVYKREVKTNEVKNA
ncbi:MAG: SdpI family protein [Spirochaetaceae bacterium]|nr:SdpI family protein [Spirochaetaceae bacterium]